MDSRRDRLHEFGEKIVRIVRDPVVSQMDRLACADPHHRDPMARRWAGLPLSEEVRQSVARDCVDETLAFLMRGIDEGQLDIWYKSDDGSMVSLHESGLSELEGWLVGDDGWLEKWAKRGRSERSGLPTISISHLPSLADARIVSFRWALGEARLVVRLWNQSVTAIVISDVRACALCGAMAAGWRHVDAAVGDSFGLFAALRADGEDVSDSTMLLIDGIEQPIAAFVLGADAQIREEAISE